MADLQNVSGGKAELQPEAISDIGVLASKKEPPAGYYIVSLPFAKFVGDLEP